MNLRQSMAVGATVALLVGGCAAHPNGSKPTAPTTHPDPAKWEAQADVPADAKLTPDQLAASTAKYARVMQTSSATPSVAPANDKPPAGPTPSSVQFDAPTTATPDHPAAAAAPVVAPAPTAPVAVVPTSPTPVDPRVNILGSAVQHHPLADMPTQVPDSADLASSLNAARANDPLGVRLAKRAKSSPQDPAAQLDLQLYALLNNGAPDGADAQLASAAGLPSDERDVIAALVDGISNFRSAVAADPNLTPTQQLRPMQDMVDRLRAGADLSLGTVALCRKVNGFGLYDPISPARFPVGRSSQLLVYCEVDNFLPQRTNDGQWETKLAQKVALYTASGTLVWEDLARGVRDVCRNRRRDFFTKEPVMLPSTLAPGSYKLKVTVTDRNANKIAESDAPLWIGGN